MKSLIKYTKYIIGLFLFLVQIESNAQTGFTIKEFSEDSVKFFDEMKSFLEASKKKEGKQFMEDFELVWYGGKFSENQRKTIYRTCNKMLERRLHAFPDFNSYLFSLMSFIESGQSQVSFSAWQKGVNLLIDDKKKRHFTEYLKFSSDLFAENAIHKSASTTWKSSNSNYVFEFEDGKPKIIFPSLDLKCFAKGDSSIIYGTKGYYIPTEGKFFADKGLINWVRAGFPTDKVYAEIPHEFVIETKSSNYEIDSVIFYNSFYFDKPLVGDLQEKVLANVVPDKASYPRFDSYSKRLEIKNITEGVDYEGGFSQHGAKFIGKGDEEKDAHMTFYWEGKEFLRVDAKSFAIRTERYSSSKAEVTFYLKQDSISHPGLQFSFNVPKRQLTLVRSDEGIGQSPYFDSYHNMDMYFEALYWKIDDPLIEMKSLEGSSNKSAKFESSKYFREYLFDRMQGIDRVHPLVAIRMCSRSQGSEELWLSEVTKCLKLPKTQVQPMLMQLAMEGFLHYDFDDDKIRIKERLYHYVDAKAKKEDYDVIKFSSEIENQSNATLNLLNLDLTLRGVKNIILSDSQKVYIYPQEQTVVIKENLDFDFNGIVNAGKFEFFGNDYRFQYEDFKIDMPIVDSIRIWANSKKEDDYGNKYEAAVTTVIEGVKGELSIDLPNNKSGIEDAPEYPIFDSQKDSYTFYSKSAIQKGVYDRKSFYFHLDPFVFDSLNSFANAAIKFTGRFKSSGIFPEFDEKLKLMPDYSLGFERPTPPEGYPMYNGKATFHNKIKLSGSGLKGDGNLKYITSTSKSNNFTFYPDSVRAIAQSYTIEEQVGQKVEFPPVTGKDVNLKWEPYKDIMFVKTIDKPFTMYDGSKLFGSLTLEPTGLSGGGLFKFAEAELESNLFKFKFSEFDSDTSDFRLKSLQESALAFSTKNVNAHVDFKERKAEFLSNGGGSFIDFPVNQYICFMDKFTWYMDTETIELGADEVADANQGAGDVKLEGSKFISVHPDQDSLQFYSGKAKYDLRKNIITAQNIKFINVADAMIYPDSGQVVVQKKAKMETLKNSKIVANNVTRYHTIYDATIDIKARRDYTASGKYDYKDELKRVKTILFEDIKVDTTYQTYADGEITKEEEFTLSPNFEYYGKVTLKSAQKHLIFSGTTTIRHNCEYLPRHSFQFSAEIDPKDIYIPIDSVILDQNEDQLFAGIMMNQDSVNLYSTFLSKTQSKNGKSDDPIVSASGFLYYNKSTGEYRISNLAKLNEISLPGNYLSFDTRNCGLYGEGNLDFTADLGQMKVNPVGEVTHDLTTDSAGMDVLMLVDFFFLDDVLEDVAKLINDVEEGIEPVNFDRKIYEKGLQELVGKEQADKLISQTTLYGSFKKVPDELNKALFINDIKLKWNKESQSYQSMGDQIGFGNFYKKQVNKYLKGYVEVAKSRSGDEFTIYFQINDQTWYFFRYKKFVMSAISSDEKFNTAVKDAKADKRKIKPAKGESPFQFMLGTTAKKNKFLRDFEGE